MPASDALAKNEELFRNVNERIAEVSAGVRRDLPLMDFLCECDRDGCEEKVQATRADTKQYERSRPTSSSYPATKIAASSASSPETTDSRSSKNKARPRPTPNRPTREVRK